MDCEVPKRTYTGLCDSKRMAAYCGTEGPLSKRVAKAGFTTPER